MSLEIDTEREREREREREFTLLSSGRRCFSLSLYVAMVIGMKLGNGLIRYTDLQSTPHTQLILTLHMLYDVPHVALVGLPHLAHAVIRKEELIECSREVLWLTHQVLLQGNSILF